MSGSAAPAQVAALGLDSAANYCWYHTGGPTSFPVTPRADMLSHSVQAWHDMTAKWNNASSPIPYIPSLSVQWDPAPRCAPSVTFHNGVCPFTPTFRSTPKEWLTALQAGKTFLDATCTGTWCPITINAWNEWSEGAYLEPDERHGTQKLEVIKKVFG
jgi:hypothetical protein